MGFKETIASLLGISAYQSVRNTSALYPQLGDATVDEIREALGGQLQPIVTTKLRWYLADLERAQCEADEGQMLPAAQLWRAMRRDGVVVGLMGTRAGGLIRLPQRFYGDEALVAELSDRNGSRGIFKEMCPPAELEALEADGIALGVGVAELVPVKGRPYPVLVRLDPEFLVYRWVENRWYFRSIAGLLPIEPGNGRWVLHVPGARMSPWTMGLWPALGRAFINKEHAMFSRSNYSGKLANPARIAESPAGATEVQRQNIFQRLLRWGHNTVVELPPGYKASLLESNGRGWDVFQEEIATSDNETMVAIAGQVVTTTGGTGFANADVHKTIREDLIKRDGESLAYTVNTQILPQYVARRYGPNAMMNRPVSVDWDTSTPKELESQARTMLTVTQAMSAMTALLEGSGAELNFDEMATRFAIPIRKLSQVPTQLQAPAEPDTSQPTSASVAAPRRLAA